MCSINLEMNGYNQKNFQEIASKIVSNEFIVCFNDYLEHSEIESLLSSSLDNSQEEEGQSVEWEIKPRENPGYFLPSDFSVIKFKGGIDLLRQRLKNNPFVKRISEEREYINLFFEEEKLKKKWHMVNDDSEDDTTETNHAPVDCLFSSQLDGFKNLTGRPHTSFLFDSDHHLDLGQFSSKVNRQLQGSTNLIDLLSIETFWESGITGRNVKVAVFDTGLDSKHPHFPHVSEITDWTTQNRKSDTLGHGTFVAGVIGSVSGKCPGIAPGSELYIFRVFTEKQTTYTSWFLDAFNYAIHLGIDILNLSIGGPDFNDRPFVEKVLELSANNIIVVSALGNDGPVYGTLNNPADQLDVIGVSSINFDSSLSSFSSRGMTTWELPRNYGRVKPDLLTYGKRVTGPDLKGGCTRLSGTSVASPVVAGGISLLLSMLDESERYERGNVAAIKQVLLAGSEKIQGLNIFEQGYGKMNLVKSARLLTMYEPHASCYPSVLDLTAPYFWPYSSQPIFYGGQPAIVNVTILNGMGVSGQLLSTPTWRAGKNGNLVGLSFDYPDQIWPWTGYLGIRIKAGQRVEQPLEAEGIISFSVISPPGIGESEFRVSNIDLPLKVRLAPTPPREKRILWDQFHNLRYPSGYFPRDHLEIADQPFDWNGDHPHTNFKTLWEVLRGNGYFIDILGEDLTCFDASLYGTLMIVDEEDEFDEKEISKLMTDLYTRGLSLIVIGDWYNPETMKKVQFHDEITQRLWVPLTGGSNLPATNSLLKPLKMAFSDQVVSGTLSGKTRGHTAYYASGTTIAQFPDDGLLYYASLEETSLSHKDQKRKKTQVVPILGLHQLAAADTAAGRVALFGDSSCLDDSFLIHRDEDCFWLLGHLLEFTMKGKVSEMLQPIKGDRSQLSKHMPAAHPPQADLFKSFSRHSNVLTQTGSNVCAEYLFEFSNATEPLLDIIWNPSDEQLNTLFPLNNEDLQTPKPALERPNTKFISNDRVILWIPYIIGALCVIGIITLLYLRDPSQAQKKTFARPQVLV